MLIVAKYCLKTLIIEIIESRRNRDQVIMVLFRPETFAFKGTSPTTTQTSSNGLSLRFGAWSVTASPEPKTVTRLLLLTSLPQPVLTCPCLWRIVIQESSKSFRWTNKLLWGSPYHSTPRQITYQMESNLKKSSRFQIHAKDFDQDRCRFISNKVDQGLCDFPGWYHHCQVRCPDQERAQALLIWCRDEWWCPKCGNGFEPRCVHANRTFFARAQINYLNPQKKRQFRTKSFPLQSLQYFAKPTRRAWAANLKSTSILSWKTSSRSSVCWTTRPLFARAGSRNKFLASTLCTRHTSEKTQTIESTTCLICATGLWAWTKKK